MTRERLLSPEEVADRLDVSPQTLANWRRNPDHELPYVNVGRLVRYRESDLEDFLDYLSGFDEDDEDEDDDADEEYEDEEEDGDYEPR
jgi:excisionase family DNA binding protein